MDQKQTSLIKNTILFSIILCLFGLLFTEIHQRKVVSGYDFKNGDILLQHLPGRLSSVIADVTGSRYSHCGMIVIKYGKTFVFEAIGPVKHTPVEKWINAGFNGYYAHYRPKHLSGDQFKKALKEAKTHVGKRYDIQYELDDKKIYSSELIYKVFLEGCNVEIGQKKTLGSLNWRPHETFFRNIADGELPLNRLIVTPESLTHSPNLELIFSNFPDSTEKIIADFHALEGSWQGDYTIKESEDARASLTLGQNAEFKDGAIQFKNGTAITIKKFAILTNDKEKNVFEASLTDTRGMNAILRFKIKDSGGRIIGTWADAHGYSGVYSLEKKKALSPSSRFAQFSHLLKKNK